MTEPLHYGPAEFAAVALAIRIVASVACVRFGLAPSHGTRDGE